MFLGSECRNRRGNIDVLLLMNFRGNLDSHIE
jgi:hypothetical protein